MLDNDYDEFFEWLKDTNRWEVGTGKSGVGKVDSVAAALDPTDLENYCYDKFLKYKSRNGVTVLLLKEIVAVTYEPKDPNGFLVLFKDGRDWFVICKDPNYKVEIIRDALIQNEKTIITIYAGE